MSVKLLTKHHLEFLTLKGGCTGSSESTLVKMPHCWRSHVTAHLVMPTSDHTGDMPYPLQFISGLIAQILCVSTYQPQHAISNNVSFWQV